MEKEYNFRVDEAVRRILINRQTLIDTTDVSSMEATIISCVVSIEPHLMEIALSLNEGMGK